MTLVFKLLKITFDDFFDIDSCFWISSTFVFFPPSGVVSFSPALSAEKLRSFKLRIGIALPMILFKAKILLI